MTVDLGDMLVVSSGDVGPMGYVVRMRSAAGIVKYLCFSSNLGV